VCIFTYVTYMFIPGNVDSVPANSETTAIAGKKFKGSTTPYLNCLTNDKIALLSSSNL